MYDIIVIKEVLIMDNSKIILEMLERIKTLEERVDRLTELCEKEPQPKKESNPTQITGGGKYRYLSSYLKNSGKDQIRLTFAEIENLIGFQLSPSARKNRANWANSETQSLACSWLKVGYKAVEVNLEKEYVVFEKTFF